MRNLSLTSGSEACSRRVLVVEDEPIVGMDIEAILSEAGLQVIGPATSAEEALELIRWDEVDCALIDFVLTDGDASTILAKLSEKNIPFAFVTGLSADGIPSAYSEIPTINKPFAAAELVNCVHLMCGRVKAA